MGQRRKAKGLIRTGMIYTWLYQQWGWFGLLGTTALFGLAFYWLLVRSSYHYYFVRHRQKYVPDYEESIDELKSAKFWSLTNIVVTAFLVLPIQLLIVFNWSKLSVSVADYSWRDFVLSALGAVLFAETCIYWLHRMLHVPPFYRWLHVVHHRFHEPNPRAALAFHPLDSFIQALPYHVYVFLVPTHVVVYFALFTFSAFWTVMIHDRVTWVPAFLRPFINHTGCHTAHHWFGRYNFCNYFTF